MNVWHLKGKLKYYMVTTNKHNSIQHSDYLVDGT